MRFRTHHQTPDSTDLEYAAEINGFNSVDSFVEAHSGSPWFTSMGWVCGWVCPSCSRWCHVTVSFKCRNILDHEQTPRNRPSVMVAVFTAIYSVRGAGGYQLFGITPAPIYDPTQTHPDFKNFMVFFKPGTIVKFDPIDRAAYDRIAEQVKARKFQFKQRPVTFSLGEFLKDPDDYNAGLLEVLRGG